MYGTGILRGLGITLRHFVDTYIKDLEWASMGKRTDPEVFAVRQGTQARGLYTVEYPDEKLATPERFRFVPFLVVNNHDDPYAPGHDWCTSCGICAKVCPPQCIWIVRGSDPNTGRPKPEPEAFYIDIDICMNCGYCAEYCPFDAIKMDHDYELASYDRTTAHIHDKARLSKEVRYWQTIAPTRALEEAQARGQWEHKDTAKLAKKKDIPMTEPVWEKRNAAIHNPDVEELARKKAAAAAAPKAATKAGAASQAAPQPVAISIDVENATPDQLAEWAADAGLPLPARAAAALRLDGLIREKAFDIKSTHRKAVSAAKKAAKAEGTTIDELAGSFTSGEVVQAAAPVAEVAAPESAEVAQAEAPAPAPAASSSALDVESASPDQLAEWASNTGLSLADRAKAAVKLEELIKAKAFDVTSNHRKALSSAKKAAKEAGTTIQDAAG